MPKKKISQRRDILRSLKEHEYHICDNCQGTGIEPPAETYGVNVSCMKCNGEGVLDWIELVVGKQTKVIEFDVEKVTVNGKDRKLKDDWTITTTDCIILSDPEIDNAIITVLYKEDKDEKTKL